MFCENCGKKIDINEKFCTSCGQAKNENNSIMEELIETDRGKKKTNVFGIIVVIIAFIIVFLIATGGIYFYKGYESGKSLQSQITSSPDTITKDQFQKKQLDDCLSSADELLRNVAEDGKNNKVTAEEFKIITDFYWKQKDECYRRYPLK